MSGSYDCRAAHIDFIRIIAIILVIFNHTGGEGFFHFSLVGVQGQGYYFYMFLSILCKVAVPLFWMVSGALLIEREETIPELLKKRVLRMLLVLVCFNLLQYFFARATMTGEALSFSEFIFRELFAGNMALAYWFIPAYIGMLLLLPIIRRMARGITDREMIYYMVITIVLTGIFPMAEYLVWHGTHQVLRESIITDFLGKYLIYMLGGYYFERRIKSEDLSMCKAFTLLTAGFLAICFSCFLTQSRIECTGEITGSGVQTFFNHLIAIPAFAIYYGIRFWFDRCHPGKALSALISMLGGASFGVMLIENLVRAKLWFVFEDMSRRMDVFAACLVWVFLIYLIAVMIILLFKRIPVLRKLL